MYVLLIRVSLHVLLTSYLLEYHSMFYLRLTYYSITPCFMYVLLIRVSLHVLLTSYLLEYHSMFYVRLTY